MINKKIVLLMSILWSCCFLASAQLYNQFDSANVQGVKNDSNFSSIRFIPGLFSRFDVDVLDNIYLVTNNNQLKKFRSNGDSIGIFNDVKKYGNPTLLDVTNPLKVLLYYKNYSTVVVLDRFLSFRNNINFRNQRIFKVQALATSYDNNIWIFDEQDFKLKKLNDEGTVLSETVDWRQLLDTVPSPSRIIDQNSFVYLYDESKGFYIFDYYGSYKNNLPFLHWKHVAVSGNKLLGFVGDTLYSYELNSFNLKAYTLPYYFKDYVDIKAMNGKVYLLRKEGIEIYNLK